MRPKISDRGQQAIGPKAKPSTNKETPRMPTSIPTSNSSATGKIAVLKTELAKVIVRVMDASANVTIHFLDLSPFKNL